MNAPSFPTRYAGARFRSRLEARWAAFFDVAGWRWEYEPPEQAGWVPDFLLVGAKQTVKVEVKPIAWFGDETACINLIDATPELRKVRNYAKRIESRTPKGEVPDYEDILVLGAYPHRLGKDGFWSWMLGVFISERWGSVPDVACLAGGYSSRQLDFHAYYGSYAYRMGGEHDGDGHLQSVSPGLVETLWRQAGNVVQWRP